MERGLSQLHVLAVILYLGCLANQSQQEVLTCSMENDTSISSYDVNRKDVRIIDGSPVQDLILLGSNQTLDFIRLDQNNNVSTADIGVCYSTAAHSCYQAGTNEEECDNYIRSVTFLHEDCPSDNCKVLVCGTNAIIPRCGICNYTAEELKCSFKQNEPPQEWPYNSTTDAGYGSCQGDNIVAGDVFQYEKNDNASSLYVHQDGKIYFGHTKRDSGSVESEIGIASISEQGEISNVIKTRENSQKMIAQDADLVGTPFIRGDYAYFLFREDSQESASSSVGQPYPLHTIRSRIARICKDDAGSSGNLVSYLKQQLLCSKKSNEVWETTPYVFDDIPMEYNEIQDFEIKEDGADTLIYAIFTNERNAYPQSALCVFSLNDIDGNFTEGDFFGSDGDVQNDLWRANDGSTVSPRHGADCSNPNTASNNFLRDYNLMDVPAVQINDTPLTMVGDRFSSLEMTEDSYIISSERGCLYQFNISTSSGDLGDPCHLNDTIEGSPIKDLESHNNGYMVTTPDNAYGFSSCNVSRDPLCSQTAVFPQPGDYSVRPNSVFNIYTENTFDSITITNITGEITDGSYLLLRNETLDAAESLVHYQILIIDETNVTMTGCDGGMMEFIISLIEPGNYTRDELVRRCDDWDLADNTSQYLKAKETSNGNFQSTILIENRQVTACENCPYNDCTTDCCEY